MLRRLFLQASIFALVIVMLSGASVSQAQTYYLGVLAPQGERAAQERWQPWLSEMNTKLSDDTLVLVPLGLENWQQQIEAQQFALVLGPQVQFIRMDTIGWRWLATLQTGAATSPLSTSIDPGSKAFRTEKTQQPFSATVVLANELNKLNELKQSHEPSAIEQVASALWVKADSNIYHLQDLEQRKVVAVDADAFGGYLLIAHLLQNNGVPPSRYQTQFVGYPIERTLSTLASGAVDAAIAPLCLMEEMAQQGKIDKSKYRLIHKVETTSNCQSSTKIYPNWTLAATEQAPAALVREINQHLFVSQIQQNELGQSAVSQVNESSSSSDSTIGLRWLPPESSSDAERILYEMNRHPAQKTLTTHMVDWIYAHRLWVGVLAFIIVISTINYGWMSWLAWRRRQQIMMQNRLIRDYDNRLRQSEHFAVIGEMSGSIAHEINQPLSTIQNYAQGLLIRSQKARADIEDVKKNAVEKQTTETALQQIVSETERVAAVISNIRRWAGRSQPDEVSVDIAATYQQCVLLLGDKANALSFWYASDYQQLRLPNLVLDQLLINTMLNSQQQGAAHIMLRCQMTENKTGRWLVLHLTDDAGGFDEERLAVNQTQSQYDIRSTKEEGLGLGLMICQRLCKSLGGIMQLSNVYVQTELNDIKALDAYYQQRHKRSINGKVQLMRTEASYPLANAIGAQVSFYLPVHVADKDPIKTSQI
ncbi:PhnD/SsuA/transferrin family substrate-binding protein [Psychrobacter sp. H8-1]|uniref:sensor histidine kinase n=1 Tax=Psychrobacter sp. H8-1 TaxID=2774129 RepID=UPI0019192570|nr:PhnD/SsuA/transferrin family substrate-binding protein [Psychrobacter sp. H8-1]